MPVQIANEKVGLIIGKAGSTIKSIQQKTGAHIQIPPSADSDNPNIRTLTVSAPSQQQAEAAQREIESVLAASEAITAARTAGGGVPVGVPTTTVYVTIPEEKIGLVIGKQGCTIRDIQTRHSCKLTIPPESDPGTRMRTITITGSAEGTHRVSMV